MTGRRGRCAVDHDAAAAAAYTAASISETVPCAAHLQDWHRLEHDFESAGPAEQWKSLDTVRQICRPCPALEECAAWAGQDKYTGFAAGNWYFSGAMSSRRVQRLLARGPGVSP